MFDFSNVNKSTAVLEIIILMLVAAIIAFVIAWIYWSRRYKRLQAEFDEYKRDNEEKLRLLQADFDKSQAELAKTEAGLMDCNARVKGLLREQREEKAAHEATRKALQDMTADRNALKIKVSGLDSKVADLQAASTLLQTEKAGLTTQLEKAEKDLKAAKAEVKKLKAELKEAQVDKPAKKAAPKKTAAKTTKSKKRKPEEVIKEIEAKRGTINFGRIGTATADNKDDLKKIKGIGPFIEQKLNALGIYTFQQISNFTPEDETSVTKAIEFFPGRIQRDNWAAQAKELAK